MEFPFGHHAHHTSHHRRNEDDRDEQPRDYYPPPGTAPPPPYYSETDFAPPPPHPYRPPSYSETEYAPPPPPQPHRPAPYYQENQYESPPPPPPQVSHVYHTSHRQELDSSWNQQPAYGGTTVQHVAHEKTHEPPIEPTETHHSYKPHFPSFVHHHSHHTSSGSGFDLSNKPTVRVYCKAEPNFSLTIRDGKVILAPSNPSDEFQCWYKDEKYSTRVKDEEGCPCFALVNKATGLAMKHSIGDTHPVQLIPYNPEFLDESILWTESKPQGDGFRAIRMVNNIHLNVDAFHGDKKSGGVHDGTIIVLWKWNKGDNQLWRITPNFRQNNMELSSSGLVGYHCCSTLGLRRDIFNTSGWVESGNRC